jgi:hypothetical protein
LSGFSAVLSAKFFSYNKAHTYEIDTDSRDVGLRVCVVGKSQKQAGLSNSRISDKEELEQVIVSARFAVSYVLGKGLFLVREASLTLHGAVMVMGNALKEQRQQVTSIKVVVLRIQRRLWRSEVDLLLWIHDGGDMCFSKSEFCTLVVVEGSTLLISLLKDEVKTSIRAALAGGYKVYLVLDEVIYARTSDALPLVLT